MFQTVVELSAVMLQALEKILISAMQKTCKFDLNIQNFISRVISLSVKSFILCFEWNSFH